MRLPQGRFFDQENDDLDADTPFLQPLAGLTSLPAPSVTYREYARVIEALQTGTPLTETSRAAVNR
ncbi:hypothetical protein ABH935_006655 [Catenulispora sp. GAS73]|uniref:hypothetical protein n=1 Tax=Catenulispora sp. GAS73 TaxID=3156269 RepID=UPI003518EFA4